MTENDGRGPSDRPALGRLIGIPTSEFASDYWGEQPLLTRVDAGFDDLFSVRAVDDLVADRALRTPFVRMASEGTVLSPSLFTGSGGYGAEIGDQIDSDRVLEQFANGATLVLQGLHRTWQPIAAFTRQLVADLGHPAQVNAYVTPASSRGFDPHYDTHDVFVIQISGAKHWTIHEPCTGIRSLVSPGRITATPSPIAPAPTRLSTRFSNRAIAIPAARMDPFRDGIGRHLDPPHDRRPCGHAPRCPVAAAVRCRGR